MAAIILDVGGVLGHTALALGIRFALNHDPRLQARGLALGDATWRRTIAATEAGPLEGAAIRAEPSPALSAHVARGPYRPGCRG